MSDAKKLSPAEQLVALQSVFCKQLPERFAVIEQAWRAFVQKTAEVDIKDLHRNVHGLTGSGGIFGANDVSQAARDVEVLLKSVIMDGGQVDMALQQQISANLTHLKQMVDAWLATAAEPELPSPLCFTTAQQGKQIYLVDANLTTSNELAVNLKQIGYEVKLFPRWEDFMAVCVRCEAPPAAILIDVDCSEELITDTDKFTRARKETSCYVPLIFMSTCQDMQVRLAAARAGALRYFTKPLDLKKLAQTLDELTSHTPDYPYRILYIEDDRQQLNYYSSVLEGSGMVVESLNDPLQVLDVMGRFQPDLVLLDVYMPACSGLELAQVIQQEDSYAQIPFIFLSTELNLDSQPAAMNLSGDDFLAKPVDPSRLVMSVSIRAKHARWMNRINRELKAALRESEYSRIALDQHAIVSLIDTEGDITSVNDKFCSSTGYTRKELIGQNMRIIGAAYHSADFYKELWNVISQGDIWRSEICEKQKNGELLWLDTTIVPFVDENGKPSKYCLISTDITDLKVAQQALMQAKTEAENANRAKSQFLSSMSHELRTPMNAIMGFSQLLQMDKSPGLSIEQLDSVKEIHNAGHHLLELINEVLDLSKIEAGRIDLSIELVDVGSVLMECISLITPLAEKRNIKIGFLLNGEDVSLQSVAEMDFKVVADVTRLKQVLLNLLSNGVKYNNEKGDLIVAFHTLVGNALRIAVTDTGDGLTTEQQGQLFTAFNRLGAEHTEIEGTGIGLVITKKIMELMGGMIGVESEVGKGSTFWIELSQGAQDEMIKMDALIQPRKKDCAPQENIQHSMLYVEDNPANLRMVAQLLKRRPNIKMWSAHEPLLGLDLASEYCPDLILLDINLPGMDGYEVLKRLRQQHKTSEIPVVAISANAMPSDIEKGLEAGFDNYLTKPIDVNNLLQVIDDFLLKH